MTNLEKHLLNTIENALNYLNVFGEKKTTRKIHNGFTLEIQTDRITLIDQDIEVAMFDRGYIQLTQIIPLIEEIIEEWGGRDEEIVIH